MHQRFALLTRAVLGSALVVLGCSVWAREGHAQAGRRDDPYAYDLRLGAFPVGFVGGISQSGVAAGARAEVDVSRRFTLMAVGRWPWLPLTGETDVHGFTLRAGLAFNIEDSIEVQKLGGSVYPEDTPAVGGARGGIEFETPISDKLGGPRLAPPDVAREVRAPLRKVYSLRLGYERVRAVERARPEPAMGGHRYIENTMHVLYAGYSWGSHWNLSPAVAGKREVGFRRFYIDALLTLEDLSSTRTVSPAGPIPPAETPDFLAIGGRLGMEGAIDALLRGTPGLGFAYCIELGVLPGTSGIEGYLFAGFGVELDLMLRPSLDSRAPGHVQP